MLLKYLKCKFICYRNSFKAKYLISKQILQYMIPTRFLREQSSFAGFFHFQNPSIYLWEEMKYLK